MTMHVITLIANKRYKHVLRNGISLASIEFGSVASFLTLSVLERNFPEGLGGVFVILWKIRREGGGVIAYLKKRKIRE